MQEIVESKHKKRRTTGFSSRIDEELLEELRQEAEKQGISANALINKILKDYCKHYRWVDRFGMIAITRPTLDSLVSCCPEEKLKEIAKISGSAGSKDALRTMGIAPTYDNLIEFIEIKMGKYGKWFDVTKYTRNRKNILHLHHGLGKNWSIFIANQVSTTIESILNKTTTSEIFTNSATIEITM